MTDPANPDYPANACGIAIEARGNAAYVKVVTTTGTVFQTVGNITGGAFTWNQGWVQQATPTPAALRAFKRSMDSVAAPHHAPKGLKGIKRP
ncbi:hypothetical protein ACFXA4_25640 [Streptomyces sp. NPDC059442]